MYALNSLNINLYGLRKAGLQGRVNLQDLAIMDYISKFFMSGRGHRYQGMVWINLDSMIENIGFLDVTTKSGISKRVKNLIELKLLDSVQNFQDKRLYLKPTTYYSDIVDFANTSERSYTVDAESFPTGNDVVSHRKQSGFPQETVSFPTGNGHQEPIPVELDLDMPILYESFPTGNGSGFPQETVGGVVSHRTHTHNNKNIINLNNTRTRNDQSEQIGSEHTDQKPIESINSENVKADVSKKTKKTVSAKSVSNDPFTYRGLNFKKYVEMGIESEAIKAYIDHRKAKGSGTQQRTLEQNLDRALDAKKIGMTPTALVDETVDRGWVKIDVNWHKAPSTQASAGHNSKLHQGFTHPHGQNAHTGAADDEQVQRFLAGRVVNG